MNIEKAWDIVREYGKYMENSRVVHMAFEEDLPFEKLEILDAVWTVITTEDFTKIENAENVKNSLFILLADLFKHLPNPDEYTTLLEYQKDLSN